MNSNTLSLRIEVDDNGSIKVRNFGKDIEETGKKGITAAGGMDKAFAALTTTLGGIALLSVGQKLVGIADTYTLIEGRLKLVTNSSEQLNGVQEKLHRTSLLTHQSMENSVTLYSGLARSTTELGISEERLLSITSNMNKAFVVSGSTQQAAGDAMRQMTQAMYGGIVRAEEYNSIMENTPRVLQAVAEGLGVTMGQLRQEMLDGQLSAQRFLAGFEEGSARIDAEFKKLPPTVSQTLGDLNTVFGSLIDGANDATGATGGIAKGIGYIASEIDAHRTEIVSLFVDMKDGAVSVVDGVGAVVGAVNDFGSTLQSINDASWGIAGPDALDWGIMGAILFKGSPGHAALAAGIITINNQLSYFDMNFGSLSKKWAGYTEDFYDTLDGLSGRRDFNTGAWITELQQVDNQIKALRESQQSKPWQFLPDPFEERRRAEEIKKAIAELEAKRTEIITGNDRYIDSWQRSSIAASKSLGNNAIALTRLKDAWQVYSDLRTTSAKAIEAAEDRLYKEKEKRLADATAAQKKHVEDVAALEATLTDEIMRGTLSRYDYAVWALEQETSKQRQLAGENQKVQGMITEAHRVGLMQAGQFSAMYSSEEQKRLTGMKDFFMLQEEEKTAAVADNYKKQEALRAELDAYLENLGNDELARAMARLEKEYQKKLEIAGKEQETLAKLSEWKKREEDKITRDNQERMLQEKLRERDVVATHLHDLTLKNQEHFLELTAMEEMWAETSKTIKTGLGNAFVEEFGRIGGAWGGLWDSMLMKMGDVVAQMAVNWAVSGVATLFEGWVKPKLFHEGIWTLKDDEVPAILQQGEMVIPRGYADEIRTFLGGNSPDNWDGLLDATRNYGAAGWGSSTDGIVADHLAGTYADAAVQAAIGAISGVVSPAQAFGSLLSPEFATSSITAALSETAVSPFAPEPSSQANFGAAIGRGFTMAGLAGFGLPGLAYGALGSLGGVVGGWIGDVMGDLTDSRTLGGVSIESIRDAVESGALTAEQGRMMERETLSEAVREMQRVRDEDQPLGLFSSSLAGAISQLSERLMGLLTITITQNSSFGTGPGMMTQAGWEGSVSKPDPGKFYGEAGVSQMDGSGATVGRTDESMADGGYGLGPEAGINSESVGLGNDDSGEGGWWASGGIVNRLLVPKGEDGWGALKLGEGVIDADTMKILSSAIRSGQFTGNDGASEEMMALLWTIASSTKKAADILTRFEYTGIPQSERRAVA